MVIVVVETNQAEYLSAHVQALYTVGIRAAPNSTWLAFTALSTG